MRARAHWATRSILIAFITLASMAGLAACRHFASADSKALWGPTAGMPTLKVVSSNYTPSETTKYHCHDHDFVLRTSNDYLYPYPLKPVYTDKAYTRCAFYTSFGLVSNDVMQLNGTIQAYHISSGAIDSVIFPIPNEKSLFAGSGFLEAFDDPLANFTIGSGGDYIAQNTNYENDYHVKDNYLPRELKDSRGKLIQGLGKIAASNSADWLLVEKDNQLYRVKADDFNNLLAFPAAVNNTSPFDQPKDDPAITNDGRYVALAGGDGPNLKFYDLSTCVADKTYNLNNATGCGSIDMIPYLSQQLAMPIEQVSYPHFSDNGQQLTLVVTVNDKGTIKREEIALVAPGAVYNQPVSDSSNYIALGDSYASGEGAYNYFSGTDEDANKCHLSKQSYPYLLEMNLRLDSAHSVACSGARMININGAGTAASQYKTKPYDAYSSYWEPGYAPQLQFVSQKQPDIVTISMVGNDIGFASIIKHCVFFGTCNSSYEDRMGLVLNVDSRFESLVTMYAQIKAAAAPDARVYVIGYPQVVTPGGNCALNVRLNKQETEFASELISYVDGVIQQAATEAGVNYVNTENAFDGHNLCSANPSAMNGLTSGNDTLGLVGDESYHPTAYGHQLLAHTIAAQTDNFTKPDPEPDWSVKAPNSNDAGHFLDAPHAGTPIRKILFDQFASQQPLLRGGLVGSKLMSSDFHLEPGASYQVWLHSTPVELGTATADSDGNLSYSYTIPKNIEPGWHTIDIYGDDITGQATDIQRLIYVAASADDWNDNGVSNAAEPCGLFSASGVDADHDGIDDACDGVITSSPETPKSQPPAISTASIGQASISPAANSGVLELNTQGGNALAQVKGASTQVPAPGTPADQADTNSAISRKTSQNHHKTFWLVYVVTPILLAVAAFSLRRATRSA